MCMALRLGISLWTLIVMYETFFTFCMSPWDSAVSEEYGIAYAL